MKGRVSMAALIVAVLAMHSTAVLAAGGNSTTSTTSGTAYQQPAQGDVTAAAQEALAQQDYETALIRLEAAMSKEPDNADIRNLMGFSLRKLGRYDEAGVAYEKALILDPDHKGALEYQGELFLKLGQLDKAKANLDRLDRLCFFGCDAYTLLKDAIARYEATH